MVERSEGRMSVWAWIVVGLTGGFGASAIVRWFLQGSRGWLLLGAYLLILALVMLSGSRGRYDRLSEAAGAPQRARRRSVSLAGMGRGIPPGQPRAPYIR